MEVSIPDHRENLKKNHSKTDVVGRWLVPIKGKLYDVELEHGRISGKRVIWVNGEEVLRRDLMYRLVGEDNFWLEDKRCIIHVNVKLFAKKKIITKLNFPRFFLRRASSILTSCSWTDLSVRSTTKRNQKFLKHGRLKSLTKFIEWCWRKTR